MSKIFLVAKRELMENFKTKSFWIGIFIFPVILGLFLVIPTLLEKAKDARKYAVIDNSGWLLNMVEENVAIGDLSKIFEKITNKSSLEGKTSLKLPDSLQQLAPVKEL